MASWLVADDLMASMLVVDELISSWLAYDILMDTWFPSLDLAILPAANHVTATFLSTNE